MNFVAASGAFDIITAVAAAVAAAAVGLATQVTVEERRTRKLVDVALDEWFKEPDLSRSAVGKLEKLRNTPARAFPVEDRERKKLLDLMLLLEKMTGQPERPLSLPKPPTIGSVG